MINFSKLIDRKSMKITFKIHVLLYTLVMLFSLLVNQASALNNQNRKNYMEKNKENILVIELKYGKVYVELLPNIAPKHVERIKTLAKKGFYDNIVFHRVIDGFMAQTGDPTGTGMGGSEFKDLPAEFSDEPHLRGAVSMARAANPNSANSQFFIVTKDSRFLDNQYSIFGRVIEGMEFVDKIKKGAGNNGMVENPDKMIKVRLLSDE